MMRRRVLYSLTIPWFALLLVDCDSGLVGALPFGKGAAGNAQNGSAGTATNGNGGNQSGTSPGGNWWDDGTGGTSTPNTPGAGGTSTGTTGTSTGATGTSTGTAGTSTGTGGTNGVPPGGDNTAGTPSTGNGGSAQPNGNGTGGGAVFVVPADAKPTPESSGIDGAFRVNTKTGRMMHDGTDFQVRGGNWFGLEGQDDTARPGAMELYIGSVFWADASNKRTIEKTMQEIKASPLSLNTIRLPISPQTLVKGHKDGDYSRTDVKVRNNDATMYPYADALEALEDFIVQADKNNLYVILDMHSCSNHIGWRAGRIDDGPPWTDANRENYKYKKEDYTCKTGEDAYDKTKWLADIHTMAQLPKKLGVKNILGIDCFNEPFKYSWSEWADLAKECYDAIAAESDDLVAIVEGVSTNHWDASGNKFDEPFGDPAANPNWGENLYGQQFDPIQIPKDRLCFSPHTYGPGVFVQKQFIDQSDPACVGLEDDAAGKAKCKLVVERSNAEVVALLRKGWDEHFGYLVDQKYCVIMGEFGGHKGWPMNNPVKPQAATIWSHLPTDVRYDWEWQNILVEYMKDKRFIDFLYWSINPESGDTGGLYNHAYTQSNESGWGVWQGLDTEKVTLLGGLQ